MSRLRDPRSGDDHPDAAGKHLNDAEVLLGADRFDGAAYHAGYVVECSLKSVILVAREGAARIHDLSKLSDKATSLAAMPSGSAARYAPDIETGHSLYDAENGWKSTLRYQSPGTVLPANAHAWVDEARRVYMATVARMRLDGVV
jgi:hypothetical protein